MEQTSPQTPQSPTKDGNTTLMAVLAYLGILVIVPFLMAKENPFVRFHIRQGLLLVIAEIAIWFLGSMSWQLWPLLSLINLACLVLAIIGIVNVIQHKEAELPLVGQFARHINI